MQRLPGKNPLLAEAEGGNGQRSLGNGPNTVSESTVSNTELSEFFGPHRVPWRELSEFLSAYYLCAQANSPSFAAELTEFAVKLSEAQWVPSSETVLSNSTIVDNKDTCMTDIFSN